MTIYVYKKVSLEHTLLFANALLTAAFVAAGCWIGVRYLIDLNGGALIGQLIIRMVANYKGEPLHPIHKAVGIASGSYLVFMFLAVVIASACGWVLQ